MTPFMQSVKKMVEARKKARRARLMEVVGGRVMLERIMKAKLKKISRNPRYRGK